MSDESALIANCAKARAMSADDLPKLGQWYWVKCHFSGEDETKEPTEKLMCAEHIASNHTHFGQHEGDQGHNVFIMHWEAFEKVRPAPEWRAHWQKESDRIQVELKEAVKKLADTCIKANLIEDPNAPKVETMLPAVTRADPKAYKRQLKHVKEKQFPARDEEVKDLMESMVGVQKNMFLSEHAQADALRNVVKKIDDRLFALELYAGFHDDVKQIADGAPAPMETPVAIRQMLRYMDEETLIAAEDGGMDFSNLKDFDAWASTNLKTIAPEPRCIVAFQIRRKFKDYGECRDIATAFAHCSWHQANMKTYLLIRNGDQAYRFATELEFAPRLLPLREEFNKPFAKSEHNWKKRENEERIITPQDVEYDEHVEARQKVMMHYNRITFLLQGLLDRTQVFSPHPPIALNDPDQVDKWVKLVYDEEDGLPSANPPVWEEYLASLNRGLKPGMVVFAFWEEEWISPSSRNNWDTRTRTCSGYMRITRIARNKKGITVNEPWGTRFRYEHKDRYGGYYGKYGEWPVNKRRHHGTSVSRVINVEAYKLGDYKRFLCDPYLKGAYLQWAPFLLKAERWHRMKAEEKEKV